MKYVIAFIQGVGIILLILFGLYIPVIFYPQLLEIPSYGFFGQFLAIMITFAIIRLKKLPKYWYAPGFLIGGLLIPFILMASCSNSRAKEVA